MCKICSSCNSIMNYDPYFEAEVCVKCGKMDREKKEEKSILSQSQSADIMKQIMSVMLARP